MSQALPRLKIAPKRGDEPFHSDGGSIGFALQDFWRWSASDLVSNTQRGVLAEFIIAKALGISTDAIRDSWQAFDLVTPEGLKIEVKSAAYLQSWSQSKLSAISFRVPKTHAWDAETGITSKEAQRQADVYVFALLAQQDKAAVDPLNVNQWCFFVLPTTLLNSRTRSQHSIALKTLESLSGPPVDYFHLRQAVRSTVGEPKSDALTSVALPVATNEMIHNNAQVG